MRRHVYRYDNYPDTPYPWLVSEDGVAEAVGFGWWSDALRCAMEAPPGQLPEYAADLNIIVMT